MENMKKKSNSKKFGDLDSSSSKSKGQEGSKWIPIPPSTTAMEPQSSSTGLGRSTSPVMSATKYHDLIDKYTEGKKIEDLYKIVEIATACNTVEELTADQCANNPFSVQDEFEKTPADLDLQNFVELVRLSEELVRKIKRTSADDEELIVSVVVESYLTSPNCVCNQAAQELKNKICAQEQKQKSEQQKGAATQHMIFNMDEDVDADGFQEAATNHSEGGNQFGPGNS